MLFAALLNISIGRLPGISPWLTAVAALVFSILSALFIFQFFLAYELIDPFFKKKTSINVIGTLRKPGTKNVKRLLILSGHHDSAWEDNWLRFLGYGFFFASTTFFIGLIAMLAMSIIQLAGADHWQCRHRSHRNTGMGHAGLSDRAFHYLFSVLPPGRKKWRKRAGRSG